MKRKPEASASEHYLQQATRGLWGRKRREVREELEAHLHERALVHRIAGLSETDAVERAVLELGHPQEVSIGMTRLHTLPTVVGSGALIAAIAVLSITLLTGSVAQSLPGTFYWPSVECVQALEKGPVKPSNRACFEATNLLWLDQQALQEALEPQGVKVETKTAGDADGLLSLTFPNSTPVYVPLGSSGIEVEDEVGETIPLAPGYFSLWDMVKAASYQDDLSIEVSGWDNPTVRVNGSSFQVGDEARPMAGADFYESYLDNVLFKDLANSIQPDPTYVGIINPRFGDAYGSAFDMDALERTSLTLENQLPGIYGVVTFLDPQSPPVLKSAFDDVATDAVFIDQVARLGTDGTAVFQLPQTTFVEGFGTKPETGTSVLVRLTGGSGIGEGWYEVVPPEDIHVQR